MEKEEPCLFCEGTGQVVSSTTISGFKTCDCIIIPQEEPKQETLKEAAINNYPEGDVWTIEQALIRRLAFMNGAKWQAERMYSEEDLVHLLNFVSKEYNISNGIGWFHTHESIEDVPSIEVLDKWFEQFKKK